MNKILRNLPSTPSLPEHSSSKKSKNNKKKRIQVLESKAVKIKLKKIEQNKSRKSKKMPRSKSFPLMELPPELQVYIFSKLGDKERGRLTIVSKKTKNIIEKNGLIPEQKPLQERAKLFTTKDRKKPKTIWHNDNIGFMFHVKNPKPFKNLSKPFRSQKRGLSFLNPLKKSKSLQSQLLGWHKG